MEKRIRVDLRDINVLRNFVNKVTQFESDINIIKGSNVFDAKSLFGVIDIAPDGVATYVEIVSDDEDEIDKFFSEMEEFRA